MAARTPGTLLAVIAIPIPVPQTRIARSKRPVGHRPGDLDRDVRVVDRGRLVDPEVDDLVPGVLEMALDRILERQPEVIGPDRDLHAPVLPRCPARPGAGLGWEHGRARAIRANRSGSSA